MDRQQLPGLTALLDRATGDGESTHDFVAKHTTLDGGDGWIGELAEVHPAVVEQVTGWLKQLHESTLASTADGVRDVNRHYQRTDDGNAASLDASVPGHEVALERVPRSLEEQLGLPQPTFAYPAQVHLRLTDPPDYSISESYKWEPVFWDVLSAQAHIRRAFITVTEFLASINWIEKPIDPFDAWTKPVVGDWAGFRSSADAFKAAAGACQDIAFNIDRSRHLLEPIWRGNAADACVTHLGTVSTAMYQAYEPLTGLYEAYKEAADAAAEYRKVVDGIIGELCDLAVALGVTIAAAGGGAGPSGGISLIVGGVLGIWPVCRFISLLHQVDDARAMAQGTIDTAKGRIHSEKPRVNVSLPQLPPVGPQSPLGQLPE